MPRKAKVVESSQNNLEDSKKVKKVKESVVKEPTREGDGHIDIKRSPKTSKRRGHIVS